MALCRRKNVAKTAVKQIFNKRIWFSKSSLADFKIIFINRVVMSAGAVAVVSQRTISTILYDLLHKQTLIQPLVLCHLSRCGCDFIHGVFSYLTIFRIFCTSFNA